MHYNLRWSACDRGSVGWNWKQLVRHKQHHTTWEMKLHVSHLDIGHPIFVLMYRKVGLCHCAERGGQRLFRVLYSYLHFGLKVSNMRSETYHPTSPWFYLNRLQSMKPARINKQTKCQYPCWQMKVPKEQIYDMFPYFNMELQVLIHGINVVEDILNNSGNNSHHAWVMELPLSVHKKVQDREF